MKKVLFLFLFALLLALTSCADNAPEVTDGCAHAFDFENCVDEALKAPADCDSAAEYYRSCSLCGEISKNASDVFTFGEALGHAFDEEAYKDEAKKSDATCTDYAWYFRSCSRCGVIDTDENNVFMGNELASHSYAETVKDEAKKQDATKASPAEYYKSCAHCGEVDYSGETFFYGDIDLVALFKEYMFLCRDLGTFTDVSQINGDDFYRARASSYTVFRESSDVTLENGEPRMRWVYKYDVNAMNAYTMAVLGITFDYSGVSKFSYSNSDATVTVSYDAATQLISYEYVGIGGMGGGAGTYEQYTYNGHTVTDGKYVISYKVDILDNWTDAFVAEKGTGEIVVNKTDSGYVIVSNAFKAN